VSRGPGGASFVMPDLIGRDAAAAMRVLQSAGLKVGDVRYRSYPGVAPGIVIRQVPAAGYRVDGRTALIATGLGILVTAWGTLAGGPAALQSWPAFPLHAMLVGLAATLTILLVGGLLSYLAPASQPPQD